MKSFLSTQRRIEVSQMTLDPRIQTDDRFLRYAHETVAANPYAAVLLSGGPLQAGDENRYSIVAWDPLLLFESKGEACLVRTDGADATCTGNPLDILDRIVASFEPDFPLMTTPFCGGAIGYLSYDLKNMIERLPQTADDDLHLPDVFLFWPRRIAVFDRTLRQMNRVTFRYAGEAGPSGSDIAFAPKEAEAERSFQIGELTSNFSHEEYVKSVRRVRHYIREGDVYQVNLSQRYRFPFKGDAFRLWRSLFELNPAPFYAFIQAGDHQVLSTSMERFLLRRGGYIETRPIKGTRKRGKSPEEDGALRKELLVSAKDDAELSMIVDLLRNDLGRVCLPRTIRVSEHKRLESYQNVHHLISIVIGQLKERTTYGDLLRATFPGGSITGCPKIRSMEIIDELEPHARHIYTGAIGYLGWHANMDLNVAIRTALIHNEICYFSVGGGIVYDSDEEEEYQETLHKGRTLFQVIEKLGENAP